MRCRTIPQKALTGASWAFMAAPTTASIGEGSFDGVSRGDCHKVDVLMGLVRGEGIYAVRQPAPQTGC
jgi:hypothetical protein